MDGQVEHREPTIGSTEVSKDIPGPKHPGSTIDNLLQPAIEPSALGPIDKLFRMMRLTCSDVPKTGAGLRIVVPKTGLAWLANSCALRIPSVGISSELGCSQKRSEG